MGKCIYCNKETEKTRIIKGYNGNLIGEQKVFCCSEEHGKETDQYIKFVLEKGTRFAILIILITFSIMITLPIAFNIKNIYIGVFIGLLPFILLGQILYIYPFTTPITTERLGIKKAKYLTEKLGRIIQLVSLILAIIIVMSAKF